VYWVQVDVKGFDAHEFIYQSGIDITQQALYRAFKKGSFFGYRTDSTERSCRFRSRPCYLAEKTSKIKQD
jgi:hypothetical protein